jgi:hypothetical protein
VVRRLRLQPPDPAQDLLTEAKLLQEAAAAGLARLDAELTGDESAQIVDRLRRSGLERADAAWELLGGHDETPSHAYARLRTAMLEAERAAVLAARDSGTAPDEVLRNILAALDVEEAVLIRSEGADSGERTFDLVPHAALRDGCDHLEAVAGEAGAPPETPEGCAECLLLGDRWVHLRRCLGCGHVGCCDSSPNRHADRHFRESGHEVMESFEPGEAWRWCYVHQIIG